MKRLAALILLVIFILPLGADARKTKITSPGDFFPDYRFSTDLSAADAAYLGVSDEMTRKGEFQVQDFWGDVLVLELFNRYCFGCQQGAPIVNKTYELVASDPALSTKVRFLGVGVGNNSRTVEQFREEFFVPFPLIPDPRFELLDALGNPGGTPYTLILRRTSRGMMVLDTHFGVYDSPEKFVQRIREVLVGDIEQILTMAEPAEVSQWIEDEMVPPVSEEDLLDLVQESMARAGYGTVGIHTVKLSSGDVVYIGESKRGKVLSRVVSRLPLCDVCHPIHFIITFNTRGKIVDFDAVSVTKYWNELWNEKDVAFMRKKLLGLSVLEEREFDPDVDAVSTATMSSTLIFDSVGRTGEIFEVLKQEGQL